MDEENLERFMKFVDVSGECWTWTGGKNTYGYGQITFDGKNWLAHRLMYLHCHGSLTPGLDICHSCRNKCVNPDHLEEKTKKENAADRVRDGTNPSGEKHGSSKLSKKQVLEIRRRSSEKQVDLAREFRVNFVTINDILSRVTWKHI